MKPTQLKRRSSRILEEIAQLGPMRKGSITQQYFETKNKDGSTGQRGPYPLYSRKRRGKTASKRIAKDRVDQYEEQIRRFRHFEDLIGELVEVAEELADAEVAQAAQKGGSKN
jgi:hypothetical protein